MAIITIRNLDESVKRSLRLRAAANGVSMEEEARRVLARSALEPAVLDSGLSRLKPTLDEILSFAEKPDVPVDSRKARDELWDYLYEGEAL